MPQKNLTTQYHQQDTNYYCGAACAQMVLAEIGAGILDQDDLYNDNHSHSVIEPGWATGPDGLQWTLVNRKPSTFANTFVLFALDNEDLISRKIVWTIHHYGVAPIALVYGSQHWIVVRGYDVSANPANAADNSYTINAVQINNPWPPTPSPAPPPPHTLGDACGSGGIRGIADEHISYATWQSDYMTGATGGHWNGKFVAVCDPELPSKTVGRSEHPKPLFDGRRIINRNEATEAAQAGLKHYNMFKKDGWSDRFNNRTPNEPLLVQRLDRMDSYYYMIPYRNSDNHSTSVVNVDARFGDYKQAAYFKEPLPHFEKNFHEKERKQLIHSIINKKINIGRRAGKLVVRPEAFCLYPTLVWKPCRESLSPFWPFHMFTIGSQHLYVRIDGAIFTTLHDTVKGI
ncbi:MAG TPA: hypothetical protein VIU12_31435 [Chryseolinea sp.]